ncbi:MAG: flippase-like domain-containing protein [Clostridia bacterium]|nr:flippase-like domain-containing protein [Clostridia bacterium]
MKKGNVTKWLRNGLLFAALIALTFWVFFRDQDMGELLHIIEEADIWYVVAGLAAMLLYFLLGSVNVWSLLRALGESVSLPQTLRYTMVEYFFSGITPAASGGQPMEIYFMSREGVSGAKATIALLIQLCGFQISTISYGLVCAILQPGMLTGWLFWLFLVGLTINIGALSVMLIGLFSQKLSAKLVALFMRLLTLLHVKDVEKRRRSAEESLANYHESAAYIKAHKLLFVRSILIVFVQVMFFHLVAYFVYRAFGLTAYGVVPIFMMQAVLYTTVSSIPLPGAMGVSEAVFLGIYGGVYGSDRLLHSAMLLYRGINFYFYMLVGLTAMLYTAFRYRKRENRLPQTRDGSR